MIIRIKINNEVTKPKTANKRLCRTFFILFQFSKYKRSYLKKITRRNKLKNETKSVLRFLWPFCFQRGILFLKRAIFLVKDVLKTDCRLTQAMVFISKTIYHDTFHEIN